MSGKGGVGKSTVSVKLCLALEQMGFKVGLLDVDLCGPSIPHLLNLDGKEVFQCDQGWSPIYSNPNKSLAVMSIAFLLKTKDDAVIWRGPKKNAMIKQFINDVHWEDRDYLIIDTPPGTSDEHISIMECLRGSPETGSVLVTTPQAVAVGDVRREITFCRKTGIKIIGLIENMSGYQCPHCSECTNVFSKGGGESLALASDLPFLGCVPLDPKMATMQRTDERIGDADVGDVFTTIARKIVGQQ